MFDLDDSYKEATFLPIDLSSNQPFSSSLQAPFLGKDTNNSIHFHNCYEFVYIHTDIDITLYANEVFHLKNGDVLMICPHVPHSIQRKPEHDDSLFGKSSYDTLYVDTDLLFEITSGFPETWKLPLSNIPHSRFMVFSQENNREITNLLFEINREMKLRHYGWGLYVASKILLMFLAISRIASMKKNALPSREKNICIQPALNYIKINYAEPIYLHLLSELCHMSQATFGRKFKQIMGTTPLDYIHTIRVQRACVLLRSSNMSILEISLAVGFVSISSFNRQFRAVKGVTPNQYRIMAPESQLTDFPLD